MNDYPPAGIEQGEQLTSTCCGNRDEPLHTSRRKWWSFMGAGSLIAVGYMDPGNYLLFVVLLASLIGMLLQWIASRVGVVTGRDLAQLCREHYSRRTTLVLWVAFEIAIIACDVAEVVGSAVALQMLFGFALIAGVVCSAVGTFAMLTLQTLGN